MKLAERLLYLRASGAPSRQRQGLIVGTISAINEIRGTTPHFSKQVHGPQSVSKLGLKPAKILHGYLLFSQVLHDHAGADLLLTCLLVTQQLHGTGHHFVVFKQHVLGPCAWCQYLMTCLSIHALDEPGCLKQGWGGLRRLYNDTETRVLSLQKTFTPSAFVEELSQAQGFSMDAAVNSVMSGSYGANINISMGPLAGRYPVSDALTAPIHDYVDTQRKMLMAVVRLLPIIILRSPFASCKGAVATLRSWKASNCEDRAPCQ